MRTRLLAWLAVGLALAAATLLGWIVVTVPDHVIPLPTPQQTRAITDPAARLSAVDSRTKLRNDMRGSLVQLFAAVGVAGGLYFTYRTFRLNRDGQVTDRFTKAVDQIGQRDKPDVALGGIYSLARLARDSRIDLRAIEDVLVAHVRRLAPYPPEANGLAANARADQIRPCRERLPTVQAALALLADLKDRDHVDLRTTDLRGTDLAKKNLRGWRLAGARFTAADLRGADLRDTGLADADLDEAVTDSLTRLPSSNRSPLPRQGNGPPGRHSPIDRHPGA